MTLDPLPSDLFARRLRQAREQKRMSQAALAEKMASLLGQNVDPSAVTRIERQERAVRLDEASAAAEALGVPLSALIVEDYAPGNQQELTQYRIQLAAAEKAWEQQRQEIERIRGIIHVLSTEHAYAEGAQQ